MSCSRWSSGRKAFLAQSRSLVLAPDSVSAGCVALPACMPQNPEWRFSLTERLQADGALQVRPLERRIVISGTQCRSGRLSSRMLT